MTRCIRSFEKYKLNEIEDELAREIAENLNEFYGEKPSEPKIHPHIYKVHLDLGKSYYYSDSFIEALYHLELAWDRMPENFRYEDEKTPEVLYLIANSYENLGNLEKAAEFAGLVIKAWVNIFEHNNDYYFIQNFEEKSSDRHTLAMATHTLVFYLRNCIEKMRYPEKQMKLKILFLKHCNYYA